MREEVSIKEMLEDIKKRYNERLYAFKSKDIETAVSILETRRQMVRSGKYKYLPSIEEHDSRVNEIFDLMDEYQERIKQLYISRGLSLSHISGMSPQAMSEGRIKRSLYCANHYETDLGDWVFASSMPLDGRNAYIARSNKGMIRIAEDAYIYGGDNFEISQSEEENRVLLKVPNYVYELNPRSFNPVVSLIRDRNGKISFDFSEEWVSDEDIDIGGGIVRSIAEIRDVTDILNNYQILCDVHDKMIGMKVLRSRSKEKALQIIKSQLQSGELRYLNGEIGINVNPVIDKLTERKDARNKKQEER